MSAGPLQQIHQLLDRLGARARGLFAAEVALQGGGVLLAGAIAVGLWLSYGGAPKVGLGLVCLAIGLALGPTSLRLLRSWAPLADRVALARRIEALRPELQSRLLTAVERAPAPNQSQALLERAIAKAAGVALTVPPAEVVPAARLRQTSRVVVLLLALSVLAELVLPIGPTGVLTLLVGGSPASARAADPEIPLSEERVLVGNIDLRYRYPDYTGLEPLVVPNTDGTIHAPPGTIVEISARAAEAYEGVALQIGEAPPVEATLTEGRVVAAQLTVTGDGTWRLLFVKGGQRFMSPDYTILAEADAAPVVSTSRWESASRSVDEPLGLRWSAQDDYGLGKVILEITDAKGQTRSVELRAPADEPRDLRGVIRQTPRELGLDVGDQVTLKVVATDAPAQGTAQRGESKPVSITIGAPRGSGKNLLAYRSALIQLLVPLLADFLEEPVPPATDVAGMARWVTTARARVQPLADRHKKQWEGRETEAMEGKVVAEVLDQAGKLLRFAVTTWDPSVGRQTQADLDTFAAMHEDLVKALESAVYLLDMMDQQVAVADLAEAAGKVAAEARELADLSDKADASEILARLDQLERQMATLAKAAQKLKGNLGEFVNSQLAETKGLMDEVRKAIAEGRMDDARALLDQLSEQMERMAENINDQMTQKSEDDNALGEALKKAMSDLEALEADQRDLAAKIDKAREEHGQDVGDQMELWRKADALAEAAASHAASAERSLGDGAGWRTQSITWIGRLAEGAAGVRNAVAARDVSGGLERISRLGAPVRMATSSTEDEARRPRINGEKPPASLPGVAQDVTAAREALAKLESLLNQLAEREQKDPPAVQQLARQLAQEQAQLRQREQALGKDVEKVERAMPTGDGKAAEAMRGSGEAMERAQESLQRGEAGPSSSHQRDAANRLAEARDHLQQQAEQMKQAQQQAQGQRKPGEGGGKGEEDSDGGTGSMSAFELPDPEDFQRPEDYRRALLEGMRGEVPAEFEALKKRYFEELVRQ